MHHTRRRDPRTAKQRDIARSVLPSTSRKGARRALRAIRRADRRTVKRALSTCREARTTIPGNGTVSDSGACWCGTGGGGLTDASNSAGCDLCGLALPDYPLSEHLQAISQRRDHDRLGSLLRWARSETDGMEPDRARRHLQRILPTGVIGTHAVTHLEGTVLPRQKWDWLLDRITVESNPR
jgi:hypothetical protein